jgi:aerobic carbon-monoxide dehydrogenase medium subunit
MPSTGYSAPLSLNEAVALLAANPGARVLAGGNTLLVEPNRTRIRDSLLVDLRKIPGLTAIEGHADGSLTIGAMTTLAAMAASDAIRTGYPILAETADTTVDAQTRNRATLGGSLAGWESDADLPAVVLALDAAVEVTGSNGSRTMSVKELFAEGRTPGAGRQARGLQSGEVLTAVILPPAAPRTGAAYEKLLHPATRGAICGVAGRVTIETDGAAQLRVAVTGATDRPSRLDGVEKALKGTPITDAAIEAAAQSAAAPGRLLDDHFASAEYRLHLMRVLTARAIRRALGSI